MSVHIHSSFSGRNASVESYTSASSRSNYSYKSSSTFNLIDGCVSCLGSTLTAIALAAIGLVVLGLSIQALAVGGALLGAAFALHSLAAGLVGGGYILGGAVGVALTTQLFRKAANLI